MGIANNTPKLDKVALLSVSGTYWETRVLIKQPLLKGLPFPRLQSRNVTATILAFLDYRASVW